MFLSTAVLLVQNRLSISETASSQQDFPFSRSAELAAPDSMRENSFLTISLLVRSRGDTTVVAFLAAAQTPVLALGWHGKFLKLGFLTDHGIVFADGGHRAR